MRELVAACDKLMEQLKSRVGRLKGVYERSDAMLANYPAGIGSENKQLISSKNGESSAKIM